ncbi:Uma2 family endonuclease [Parasediminibacterium sp. JCM 36343]|uniref:Uma2 family endonuclease n=1 Tax=Parasediminibacterium sp. JCM 36343 TaxID=3374279 RepID=UPI00397E0447
MENNFYFSSKISSHGYIAKEWKQKPNLKFLVQELNQMILEEDKLRNDFYNIITEDDKAEFINGEVIMHSPVKRIHGNCMIMLSRLISAYVDLHELGEADAEKRMIALTRNSYEPDIVFFKSGKATQFKDNQMLFPAPDFIAEIISPSTEQNDRGIKFTDYALHGVEEYWLIDPQHQTVEQYLLEKDTYQLEFKGKNGIISSKAIKGFAINAKALFNKKENIAALQAILNG